jgi:hypothetical protein
MFYTIPKPGPLKGTKLEAATRFYSFDWVAASSRLPFIGMGMAFLM